MFFTCYAVDNMSKMVQIRNLRDDVHRVLKMRAAKEGMSLSDYLKRHLEEMAGRPTLQEWLRSVWESRPSSPDIDSAKIIREMRDAASRY